MQQIKFKTIGLVLAYIGMMVGLYSSSIIANTGFTYGMASVLFTIISVGFFSDQKKRLKSRHK